MLKKDMISKLTHLQQLLMAPVQYNVLYSYSRSPPTFFHTLYVCLHVRLEIN